MAKLTVPLLCVSVLIGITSLFAIPPTLEQHGGIVLFALFCTVIPAFTWHFAAGYFVKRLAALGRYVEPAKAFKETMFDRAFLTKVYAFQPDYKIDRVMRIAFFMSYGCAFCGLVITLALGFTFGN